MINREIGDIRRSFEVLELERRIYDEVFSQQARARCREPSYVDLLEGFAGKALPSILADSYQLTAIEPAELTEGWNLGTKAGRELWEWNLEHRKPLLTILGFPCTLWCLFNRNINFKDRPELLHALQDAERPLLRLTCRTAETQSKGGRLFLLEQPAGSSAYDQPELSPVFDLPRTK